MKNYAYHVPRREWARDTRFCLYVFFLLVYSGIATITTTAYDLLNDTYLTMINDNL